MDSLLVQWGALAGFAALIAFLVNILKVVGLVEDGHAPYWSAALNLLGLAGLLAVNVYAPELDVAGLDAKVAGFVEVGLVVFGYILQLLGSKVTHYAVKGLPVVGKSYS